MTTYRDKAARERFVVKTYLCIALPFMLAAMIGSAAGYAAVFSLGPESPLSWLQLIGLTLTMVAAIVVGLAIGVWVWAMLGKLFLGISRSEIERLFAGGPQIPMVSRYNDWCLNLVFGPPGILRQCNGEYDDGAVVAEHCGQDHRSLRAPDDSSQSPPRAMEEC